MTNISFTEMLEKEDKARKGYMFESLVFRYKLAREAEMRANIENGIKDARFTGKDPYDIKRKEKNNCERDFMRFIEILNKLLENTIKEN